MNRSFNFNLLSQIPEFTKTRFAPSPTGFLHLGHVSNALFVWLIARLKNAQVVLRIEDHDRIRSKPEYAESIFQDLNTLGLAPDLGENWQSSRYVQSRNLERYASGLKSLKTYYCMCSRLDIENRSGAKGEDIPYDGHCRYLNLTSGAIRLHWEPDLVSFTDFRLGRITQRPKDQCGDLLLKDRNHNYTYQYSVVIDDYLDEIDLVIRGEDLLESTGRQIRLHQLLNNPIVPSYLHHGLLLDTDGKKLSKRFYSESIKSLLQQGKTPEDLIGTAAFQVGLLPNDKPLGFEELVGFYQKNI